MSSNEKVIDGFAKKVAEREKSFQKLIAKTEDNTTQLNDFQAERKSYLAEAKKLIESAKLALEYKTAEGLSAAFSTEKGSYSGFSRYIWVVLSGICLGIAIYLGNSILGLSKEQLPMIIGRLALVPLPLGAMWFCAGQYVKISNIWADYGYKMTLARSLVGFSEELKKRTGESEEEYRHYIKTVLEQIHQDPLRSRKPSSSKKFTSDPIKESEGVIDLVEKVILLTKGGSNS